MNGYTFNHEVNKGVAFGLNNVQFLCKGEPLSGRTRAEDDFGVWDSGDSTGNDVEPDDSLF